MKPILLLVLLFVFTNQCLGQKTNISGIIIDSLNKKPLSMVSVSIISAKDSVLNNLARSGVSGEFAINISAPGDYILTLSYGNYVSKSTRFTIQATRKNVDMKYLLMSPKSNLLNEVYVTGSRNTAISMKGDTLQFKADSFKVSPNGRVEDILRQIPGVVIDKAGKLTVEGTSVKKVLVNGEEFFGDDPTLITRNIRADLVDKIQIYDKTSRQSAFTGVDDGIRDKTLDVRLKKNKDNGVFGKTTLGVGNKSFYNADAIINKFNGNEKVSAYASVSNNSVSGLNWETVQPENRVSNYNQGIDIWSGSYEGQGIPEIQTGGAHYDNKFAHQHLYVNANYKTAQLSIDGQSDNSIQLLFPDNNNFTNSQQHFSNKSFKNKADVTMDWTLSPKSMLNVALTGSTDHKSSRNSFAQDTHDDSGFILNKSERALVGKTDDKNLFVSMTWNYKLDKKGRTLSVFLNQKSQNSVQNGLLKSSNSFFSKNDLTDTIQKTDQDKTNNRDFYTLESKIVYSEPLSKSSGLSFNYGLIIDNARTNLKSYNIDAVTPDRNLDSLNSSNFKYNQLMNRGGIAFNLTTARLIFHIGSDAGLNNYIQQDFLHHQYLNRSYLNWFPMLTLKYVFNPQRRLSFYYYGQTAQPNLSQLQPVVNNSDPVNVYVGNANLTPSFKQTFNFLYKDYNFFSDRTLLINAAYVMTSNPIVTNIHVDSVGRNVFNYGNISNQAVTSFNGYVIYSKKIGFWGLKLSFDGGLMSSKYANYTNSILNLTRANTYTFGMGIKKTALSKFEISVDGNVNYNHNASTVGINNINNYWSSHLTPYIDWYITGKIQIHTDGDYSYQQRTQNLTKINMLIWNAWIGQKFLSNNLLVKISANDLLNQNTGFKRYVLNNILTQNSYTTIKRYFMLTIAYDFNKFK